MGKTIDLADLVIKTIETIPDKLTEQGGRDVGMPPFAVRNIWVMLHTQFYLKEKCTTPR